MKRGVDLVQSRVEITFNKLCRDTHEANAKRFQGRLSCPIRQRLLHMNGIVDLDGESGIVAIEVEYEWPNRLLPMELVRCESAIAQRPPEHAL